MYVKYNLLNDNLIKHYTSSHTTTPLSTLGTVFHVCSTRTTHGMIKKQ